MSTFCGKGMCVSINDLALFCVVYGMLVASFVRPNGTVQQPTGNDQDIAVFGDGLLQVAGPSGALAYARTGRISIDDKGSLSLVVIGDLWRITPQITMPLGSKSINISVDGAVSVAQPDMNDRNVVGRLYLVKFANSDDLLEVSPNIFRQTNVSIATSYAGVGEGDTSFIRQGWTEGSSSNGPLSLRTILYGAWVIGLVWALFKICSVRWRSEQIRE